MKIIPIILVVKLFLLSISLAGEPDYTNDLNQNIREFNWKIKNTSIPVGSQSSTTEIITLTKNNWLLKCAIHYFPYNRSDTRCSLP